jgi:flavin-dependent dehydrogenase
MCGIAIGLLTGIALEGNVTPKVEFPPMWEDTLGLDVGTVPGGYGWIFPKGDHLNLGIGGWKYVGPDLKWHLKGLVEYYGYSMEDVWGQRGYHLPIRQKYSPLADGNVALVGDAAGLVDPLTGEGIHSALWSGRSAAKHIAEYVNGDAPDLSGYEREVMSEIVPELRISRQFHDLFNLAPQIFIGIERRTGWLWGVTERIILGDETYETLMQRRENLRLLVDLASDFVRVTPMLQRAAGLRDPAPPQRFFTGKAHQ